MFKFEFVGSTRLNAIFNIADVFISCCGVVLCLYIIFGGEKEAAGPGRFLLKSSSKLLDRSLGGHLLGRPRGARSPRGPIPLTPPGGSESPRAQGFACGKTLDAPEARPAPCAGKKRPSDRSVFESPYSPNFSIAALAATCSASFFVLPSPWPATSPPTDTSMTNTRQWSGPVSRTRR